MVIHTKRCIIRPFQESDIDEFMAYRNDMDWMKYQGFKGLDRQAYIDALVGNNSLPNGVQLAVVCSKTNSLVGDVYIKEDASVYWIGYTTSRFMARQGFAYEVVSAVIDALRARGATCFKAGVEAENDASIALLKKLGFRHFERGNGEEIFAVDFCAE